MLTAPSSHLQRRLFLALVLVIPSALARADEAASGKETVTAGARYRASGMHRVLFGSDYRDLWTMPVTAEVLDLRTFAGGLTPIRRVGGQQTKGLALKGADGRSYTFRGADKDPTSILPPSLQGSFADKIVQDQIASGHPAGPVMADMLLEAAGVLYAGHHFVVMPDDPALGEFREVFAGLPGTIEEFPGPAPGMQTTFAGATEIIYYEEMWRRLQASPADRVDTRAFLRARLVDLLMGDWDRHRKQWRWARIPGNDKWQPIPEDRDQAFSSFEGLVLAMSRARLPMFVKFEEDYPKIVGLTFNGWDVDRYLLADLEWPDWQAVARDVQGRITDAVIQGAVDRLPPQYEARSGARIARILKSRRDKLVSEAERFYRLLAHRVDVQMTDRDERVEVRHRDNGDAEVRVGLRASDGSAEEAPYFQRVFRKGETGEVRLYLRGGDDLVVTQGRPRGVRVRAIGDAGKDAVDDSHGGGTRLSDTGGAEVRPGPGTHLDTRPYVPPPPNPHAPWIPPRDWGSLTLVNPWVAAGPDIGVFLGLKVTRDGYGFRKDPFATRQTFGAGYATTAKRPRFEYEGLYRRENSDTWTSLLARASGIEVLRFYGFGNETKADHPQSFFRVKQTQYLLEPAINFSLAPRWKLSLGPVVKYSTTDQDPTRFVGITQPYGSENFGQVGAALGLTFDGRDRRVAASRGVLFDVGGRVYPQVWNVETTFGEVHGEAATYLSTSGSSPAATLALRVAGKSVFGTYPFQESAFIGGGATVRGFVAQRFAGDSSLYGNAELRLRLAHIYILFPGDFGVFGLTDVGRVYFEGESSDKWHTGYGGGIWLAFLNPNNTVSLAVATSEEKTGVYFRAGFIF